MRSVSFLVILGLAVITVPMGHATSFAQKSFAQATSEAEIIVRGTIGMSYGNWAKALDGVVRLYTFTELQVGEVLKGELPGDAIILRELGGRKDGVNLHIPGAALFKRGEDVIVFLSSVPFPDGSYQLRGMTMGKYQVIKGEDGQEQMWGGRITGDTDGDEAKPAHPQKWTLSAFRDLIRKQAASPNDSRETPKPASTAGISPAKNPVLKIPEKSETQMKAAQENETPDLNERHRWLTTGLGVILGAVLYAWMRRRRNHRRK